jgi:hypothetical protein
VAAAAATLRRWRLFAGRYVPVIELRSVQSRLLRFAILPYADIGHAWY